MMPQAWAPRPPTVHSAALDEEESYLDQPVELDPFEDGGSDDEEASDLIVGEEIDVLGESLGDNEPLELDLGALVGLDDPRLSTQNEDDAGFEVDPAIGLALPDTSTPDDGTEGVEDGSITVDESKFPSLEMDDGSEGIAAEREITLGTAADEAALPLANVQWHVLPTVLPLEACAALAAGGDAVVAGSSDLLWFRGDRLAPLRLALDRSTISDLVLCGATQDIALACTPSGQLFRRARLASQAEQLTRFREHFKPTATRQELSFGGSLSVRNGRIFVWAQDGTVLEVFESGDRFERLELDGKVVSIARESATLLLARGSTRELLFLDRTPLARRPLSGPAQLIAASSRPLLASSLDALALGEPSSGLLVSSDAGNSFRRVPGIDNLSAIAGAEISGSPRFFAAVYRETSDETQILLVDPERGEAHSVARFDTLGEHAPAPGTDRGEWAKVARLSWHAASGRLWAAGGFGVLSFASPEPR